MTSAGPHLFWITSRAAGIAALTLSSASLGAGLMIRGRGDGRRLAGADLRVLHEALALAALVAIAVHGVALLGDGFLHPSLTEIAVPFVGTYRPLWTGLGILAGWGLALLGLSFYARQSIGAARWRYLHRFIAIFWALGIAHTLGAGTDAGQIWLLALVAVPAAPGTLLLAVRLLRAANERDPAAGLQPAVESTAIRENSA